MAKQYKIAEIADMFNVSRASVNRAIDKLDSEIDFKVKFVHSSSKSKTAPKLVDEAGIEYLSSELGERHNTNDGLSNEQIESNQVLKVLIKQLEEKDSQLAEKDSQLAKKDRQIQNLQESEKDLRDLLKAQAGQLLQINTSVKALNESSVLADEQDGKVIKSNAEQAEQAVVNKSRNGLFGWLKREK